MVQVHGAYLVLDTDLDREQYAGWMTVQKGIRHPLLHVCFGPESGSFVPHPVW